LIDIEGKYLRDQSFYKKWKFKYYFDLIHIDDCKIFYFGLSLGFIYMIKLFIKTKRT
jgi:hypothetical protein